MPLQKPTHKKPREVIEYYEECTWLGNDTPMFQNDKVSVFQDKYPVIKGHLLFVPKTLEHVNIVHCFAGAYNWGNKGVEDGDFEAYNIGYNNGAVAGQSVFWPHIHLIPRRKGDVENPKGGVRHVIPRKGNY